jgi:TRAP transporter TAXI family solute receptor
VNDVSIFGAPVSYEDIKAVAGGLYISYFYLIARKDFPANDFDDLVKMIREGKTFRIGGDVAGSGEELMLRLVLRAYNLTYDDLKAVGIPILMIGDDPAQQALIEGKIDVFYQVGGRYFGRVDQIRASIKDIKFIAIPEHVRDFLVKNYGLAKLSLSKDTYKWLEADIPTIGYTVVLVARKELPEDLVYYIVDLLARNKDYIAAAYKPFEEFDVSKACQLVGLWQPHPGAIKYCKEKGFLP